MTAQQLSVDMFGQVPECSTHNSRQSKSHLQQIGDLLRAVVQRAQRVVGHVGPFNACEEGLQAGSVQP